MLGDQAWKWNQIRGPSSQAWSQLVAYRIQKETGELVVGCGWVVKASQRAQDIGRCGLSGPELPCPHHRQQPRCKAALAGLELLIHGSRQAGMEGGGENSEGSCYYSSTQWDPGMDSGHQAVGRMVALSSRFIWFRSWPNPREASS